MKNKKKASIFENDHLKTYLKMTFMRDELDDLYKMIRDQTWLENVKKEAPEENTEKIIKELKATYQKLTDDYIKLRKTFYQSKQGSKQLMQRPRIVETKSRINDNAKMEIGGPTVYRHGWPFCKQIGIQRINFTQDTFELLYPEEAVFGSSTWDSDWSIRPDVVMFDMYINNNLPYWNRITKYKEAGFRLPPAPCDGRLGWETNVRFNNYGYIKNALGGHLRVHVVKAVIEDITVPEPKIQVYITGNLFTHSGDGTSEDGGPILFSGQHPVVQGQESEIWFLLLVELKASSGRVETHGTFTFDPPPPDILGWGGVKYAFY